MVNAKLNLSINNLQVKWFRLT